MSPRNWLAAATAAALVTLALAGCIVPAAQSTPTVREIDMWVEQMDWEIHPGVTTPIWAFCAEGNGVEPLHDGPCGVPGPTLRVTAGDWIRLTFHNTHAIPHTVHFHGWHEFPVDMNGNHLLHQHMVVGPGEKQVFEWRAEPAGTFIYHCHFDTPTHMEMGMYGAFIVEDPAEKDRPDHEFVAVLDEWMIGDEPAFHGNMPAYNYFTINGRSFPTTQPWIVDPGDRVRVHMVNAGYEFHAMHLHGHTPLSWEGVAGPGHAVPTDVRSIAPGQSVVLEFTADREGVWFFHDHVVPRVTAASDGSGFGIYPRGMLTALVVGQAYADALFELVPVLLGDAARDVPGTTDTPNSHHDSHEATVPPSPPADGIKLAMRDFAYETKELRVPAGSTVTWINQDPVWHDVSFSDGSVKSGQIQPNSSWSYTFKEAGTYTYYCSPHAYQDGDEWKGMVATVIVE